MKCRTKPLAIFSFVYDYALLTILFILLFPIRWLFNHCVFITCLECLFKKFEVKIKNVHGYIGRWTSRKMSQQPKKLRSCLEMTKQKIEMWDTQHSMSVVVSSWDPKGLLSMIDMKIAEYVKHAFHAGMLRQAVGSGSASVTCCRKCWSVRCKCGYERGTIRQSCQYGFVL